MEVRTLLLLSAHGQGSARLGQMFPSVRGAQQSIFLFERRHLIPQGFNRCYQRSEQLLVLLKDWRCSS